MIPERLGVHGRNQTLGRQVCEADAHDVAVAFGRGVEDGQSRDHGPVKVRHGFDHQPPDHIRVDARTRIVLSQLADNQHVNLVKPQPAHHNAGARYRVTKNRLVKRALEGTPFEGLAPLFTGPTAIAFSRDPVAAAKAAVEFANRNDKLTIVGGGLQGQALDAAAVRALATLPSLDELRGKIIGLIQAPATKLAGLLQAPAGQLARVLAAHAEQGGASVPGGASGESPALAEGASPESGASGESPAPAEEASAESGAAGGALHLLKGPPPRRRVGKPCPC